MQLKRTNHTQNLTEQKEIDSSVYGYKNDEQFIDKSVIWTRARARCSKNVRTFFNSIA